MTIEFEYHLDASELQGIEFAENAGQEITLLCECDYDYCTDTGPSACLCTALIKETRTDSDDWRDVMDCIPESLRLEIEERAIEVDSDRAYAKHCGRIDRYAEDAKDRRAGVSDE